MVVATLAGGTSTGAAGNPPLIDAARRGDAPVIRQLLSAGADVNTTAGGGGTIGSDPSGQAYNINADTVAGALAEAVGAEKAVFLTDVAGLLADVDDPTSLISHVTAGELQAMIDDGRLTGGMIPKIAAALHAVRNGVASAHLLDGRVPHVLLLELFSDAGVGTMVTAAATPTPEETGA